MSTSKRKPRPSSGNLRIPVRFAEMIRTPDGEGGFTQTFLDRGTVWCALHTGRIPTERLVTGDDRHIQQLFLVARASQAFLLPSGGECLRWKIQHYGEWCKLSTLHRLDERGDFVILELHKGGAVLPGEPITPPTGFFYDGVYNHNGLGAY